MVSVIVPVYNVEPYLRKCIESILHQDFSDFEVLLIDDGSTDKSGEICDIFSKKDSRIHVIHQKNMGLAATRRIGVSEASGGYIAFVDGDDWIDTDFISSLYEETKIGGHVIDMVTSVHICEGSGGTKVSTSAAEDGIYSRTEILYRILPIMSWDFAKDDRGILASVCVKLFRKELLDEIIRDVDPHITVGEDGAIVYPFLLKAQYITVTHYAGYHYMMNDASMLHRLSLDKFEDARVLHEYLNRKFEEAGLRPQLQDQIDQYTWSCVKQIIWGVYGFAPEDLLKPFTFFDLPQGCRVVLYGAGKAGKRIYREIVCSRYAEIVGWIDQNPDGLIRQMEIRSVPEISSVIFDYVLITVRNKEQVESIKVDLISNGVEEGKILWAYPTE